MAGNKYKDEDLIFCSKLGQKLDTKCFYRIHCETLEKVGIEHSAFHDLRHTVATLLLQSGENLKIVQDLLEHADAETTMNTYAHVLEEMKYSAANRLDDIFSVYYQKKKRSRRVILSQLVLVNII